MKATIGTSRLANMLARMALSSGVGYIAAAYTASRWLTRTSRGKPRLTPDALGTRSEPIECQTADGMRLRGWVITPAQVRGTIALFHGIRQRRDQTLTRAIFLSRHGYRCVAFDHRAHGESTGKQTSFGFRESRDVAAVFQLLRERWPHGPRGALGISMGAAAICFAAPESIGFNAFVLESPYYDLDSTFSNRINNGYPHWFQKLRRGVVWVTEKRLGIRIDEVAPAKHIARLAPAATMIVSGSADVHATPDEARRLHDLCRDPRELYVVDGAGHRDVYEKGGDAYRHKLLSFFEQWM